MKGDQSLLLATNEVTNLFSNSDLTYFQYGESASLLEANPESYHGPDRFTLVRTGTGRAGDAFIQSTDVPDPQFDFSVDATREHGASDEHLNIYQKIESIFSSRLTIEGRASFSFFVKPLQDIASINIDFFYPSSKDNWPGGSTLFHSVSLTAGVDFNIGEWFQPKVENVPMPTQVSNGLMVRIRTNALESSFPEFTQIKTTGWQCNEGRKVLPWRLMLENRFEELGILQRYAEIGFTTYANINFEESSTNNRLAILGGKFSTIKRSGPTVTFYGTGDITNSRGLPGLNGMGNANSVRLYNAGKFWGVDTIGGILSRSYIGLYLILNANTDSGEAYYFSFWMAKAEL